MKKIIYLSIYIAALVIGIAFIDFMSGILVEIGQTMIIGVHFGIIVISTLCAAFWLLCFWIAEKIVKK